MTYDPMPRKETDPDYTAFIGWCSRTVRRIMVARLLAGNDAQCFSTRQYADAYRASKWNSEVIAMTDELARQHLLSVPDAVREVRPDVWAAVEGPTP